MSARITGNIIGMLLALAIILAHDLPMLAVFLLSFGLTFAGGVIGMAIDRENGY